MMVIVVGVTAFTRGLEDSPPATRHAQLVVSYTAMFFNYAVVVPVLLGFTRARNLNEVISHTGIGPYQLRGQLDPSHLVGIYVGNVFMIIFTLGIYTPWAQLRTTRYLCESLAVLAEDDLGGFAAGPAEPAGSAAGEELSSFLDLDFGF
jgi:uncharacterized membrane protein YjgN (DUF898 family)